jgi:DNA-directed RNA polymerase specialized sigma24 family protein
MLGSQSQADDAVQKAWLRLRRSDTSGVTAYFAVLRVGRPV